MRSYFVPRFFTGAGSPQLQGAIILDTILNYNNTHLSQTVPADWSDKVVGNVKEEIEENKNRGDFIALIARHGVDDELVNNLEKHWNDLLDDQLYIDQVNRKPGMYKLKKIQTTLPGSLPPLKHLAQYYHFTRSDHVRFWYSNEFNFQGSFNSVLITDTGMMMKSLITNYTDHWLQDPTEAP